MEEQLNCYCGSGQSFITCCEPLVMNKAQATTAEQLMRSRYTAYALANAIYIINTTHPSTRHYHSKRAILQWAKENTWKGLEVISSSEKRVVFKASYQDKAGNVCTHYEDSLFDVLGGKWYYVSGTFTE